MVSELPDTPSKLRRYLASRLAIAGTIIGILAGSIAYFVETNRVEEAVFKAALDSASHIRSFQVEASAFNPTNERHPELKELLKTNHFVAIRILDSSGTPTLEAWDVVPESLVLAISAHRAEYLPASGTHHHRWLNVDGEKFILVILPLHGSAELPYGYLEGVYRIDPEVRKAQLERVRTSVATAVIATLLALLLTYPLMLRLIRRSLFLSQSLLEANVDLMQTLGSAVAKRDGDTDIHNYRVTLYAVRLAQALGMEDDEIATLIVGAFLHDVGKIGIPDHILLKEVGLSPDEFNVMKTHVLLGVDIARHTPWLSAALEVIQGHHERFDGTGYPFGLTGKDIPYKARLFAVVDVFDALTSKRPYKEPLPADTALKMMQDENGKHFDPEIVLVFQSIALQLYAEIHFAEEKELHEKMRHVVCHYFKVGNVPVAERRPIC